MTHDDKPPIAIPLSELKEMAVSVANDLKSSAGVPPDVRQRFINVRAALFQRGIFDPVLVRFDSATAPLATKEEIADRLTTVVESLS